MYRFYLPDTSTTRPDRTWTSSRPGSRSGSAQPRPEADRVRGDPVLARDEELVRAWRAEDGRPRDPVYGALAVGHVIRRTDQQIVVTAGERGTEVVDGLRHLAHIRLGEEDVTVSGGA